MAAGPRPLEELVEEAADRLTSEQLHALAARVAAAEARPPAPPPTFDLATSCALDLQLTVRRAVALWVDGVGLDTDIFAGWYVPQLVRAGVTERDALSALRRVTGWKPRTAPDRERAVARSMLADGWAPEMIADALKEAVPC